MYRCTIILTLFLEQTVLIHGLSIPAMVWKDVAPTLAARGFRVLLYGAYFGMYARHLVLTISVSRSLRTRIL